MFAIDSRLLYKTPHRENKKIALNSTVGAPLGNQNAKKENRLWRETVHRVLVQNDAEKLRKAAEKLVELAVAGDVAALREVGDRLDGKAAQQINHAGHDGEALVVKLDNADGAA